mmetsp:Transcript_65594/g.165285  ORF Transcript_65594/g.165285 Transcript_65594/m.165285 type:complete len:586 (+) Transcript_65594:92-1849(+)
MAEFGRAAGCRGPTAVCIGAVTDQTGLDTSPCSLRGRGRAPAGSFLRSQFECCESRDLYRARRRWFMEKGRLGHTISEDGGAEQLGRFARECSSASRRGDDWAAPQGCTSHRVVYQREREWYAAQQREQPAVADRCAVAAAARCSAAGVLAWGELARACSIMVLTLSCWFGSNAFLDEISLDYDLHNLQGPFLTASVNLGFMLAATAAAMLQVPDRFPRRRLVITGALTCAATSATFVVRQPYGMLVTLRLWTGAGISLIYPILVKHVVTWFDQQRRGLALSILIGSFTLGIAAPSLIRALMPSLPWRLVNLTTAGFSLLGCALAWGMKDGPYAQRQSSSFSAKAVLRVLRDRNWWLVTLSYVGHNMELFGGWSSLGPFLQASFGVHMDQGEETSAAVVSLASFGVIAAGCIGAIVGGYLADRVGRRIVIAASHLVSGSILALLPSLRSVAPPWVLAGAAGLWGSVAIADSAQYSAIISEVLADGGLIGTAVALSLAFGFSSTAVGIFAVPFLRDSIGWAGAFPCLALGPALGSLAILAVRLQPPARPSPADSAFLADGWGKCRQACRLFARGSFQTRRPHEDRC